MPVHCVRQFVMSYTKPEVETAYSSSRRQEPALFPSSCASLVAYKLYILSMTNAWRSLGMRVVYTKDFQTEAALFLHYLCRHLPPPHVRRVGAWE